MDVPLYKGSALGFDNIARCATNTGMDLETSEYLNYLFPSLDPTSQLSICWDAAGIRHATNNFPHSELDS